MLQTAFRPSCVNQASVFEWHKRFKEGRESVWDNERCVRSKEVRTPELIGQIKNFMNKDCRVSIETKVHSLMSVWELYTQLFARNWRCGRFVPMVLREDQKERWSNWSIQIPQFLMLWWPAMKAGFTAMTQRPRNRVPSGRMLALPNPRRSDWANPPTNFWWSLFWQHWHDLHALGSHWTDSQQGILCWGFKGVQEEILSEEASTLQIGSVAFPQGKCTSPQLHRCHRLFEQDGHQDSCSPSL